MPAPSRLRALPVWGALCLLAVGPGCERRGVMALPTTPAAEAVRAPPPGHAEVPAAVGRVRALESACRRAQRLQTQGAAARTMDRVRMVLGAFCDVETVGGDPLHWQLRCRANAFFALGQYVPISGADATPPCPALRNAPVDRWTCAGALLHEFVSDAGRVELAAVGHVDHVPLAATARFDGCPALREAMGFNPAEPWYRSVPDAPPPPEAERARGNAQLAWCRAAQTARAVRCGMTLADRGGPVPAEACDALPAATLFPADARATTTALGAGTAWMDAQAPGSCLPGPPVNGVALPGDCPRRAPGRPLRAARARQRRPGGRLPRGRTRRRRGPRVLATLPRARRHRRAGRAPHRDRPRRPLRARDGPARRLDSCARAIARPRLPLGRPRAHPQHPRPTLSPPPAARPRSTGYAVPR
jgi:hypothetical protein